ncbi:MAG: CHAT domain-containing protein [Candidatus Helarchaeota archaeon]
MNLLPSEKKFLAILEENFIIISIEEFLALVEKLKAESVKNKTLRKIMELFIKIQTSFESEKRKLPPIEMLKALNELITEVVDTGISVLGVPLIYLRNFFQSIVLDSIPPLDKLYRSTSSQFMECCANNAKIAAKSQNIEVEAYYQFKMAKRQLYLFEFWVKNKELLENANSLLKEVLRKYEKLANYEQMGNCYSLFSSILEKLAQFYIDTDPSMFRKLIKASYETTIKGVDLFREKMPDRLPEILLDAIGAVTALGRIQKSAEESEFYFKQALALADEGFKRVDLNNPNHRFLIEGLHNNKGVTLSYRGDLEPKGTERLKWYEKSLEEKLKALEMAKQLKIPFIIIRDLTNIGQSYLKMASIKREDSQRYRELIQKATAFFKEVLTFEREMKLDSKAIRELLTSGELLSKIYAQMLIFTKDHEERLKWLEEKLNQDRQNVQLAKRWGVRPLLIAENCIDAANSIYRIVDKLDNVMVIRELYQEQIELLQEAIKILEDLKIENDKLIECHRKICGIYQELSRIDPSRRKRYELLLEGKQFGEKALQLAKKLEKKYDLINICDNYGLLVHDIGHAIELKDKEKAKEFFTESIEIFQTGLDIAKELSDSTASQAVLLDYIGGSYRDLANLSDENTIKKEFLRKSAEVKEKSLELFEEYEKAPYDTAVTAESLAITLNQLGRVEDDSRKARDIFNKAIQHKQRSIELFTLTRKHSKAFRSQLSILVELKPNVLLHSAKIETDSKKRWQLISEMRTSLQEGKELSKGSPVYQTLAEYLLWEFPKQVTNGVETAGFRISWDKKQNRIQILNLSYQRKVEFELTAIIDNVHIPVSEVKFEIELEQDKIQLTPNALIRILFKKNYEFQILIPIRYGSKTLEQKLIIIRNPNPEPLKIKLTTPTGNITTTENKFTIIGERNILVIKKRPIESSKQSAIFELQQEEINGLYQINIIPRFSGILCITDPDSTKWKYNLGACLFEGPLMFDDAPHVVETDFSPIIFMEENGSLPTKFFNVKEDLTDVSGSLVDLNERYPRIIRKIFIMGEIFRKKPPYERIEMLNLLKKVITNIATVNDPMAGITILTSDAQYYNEMYSLIEREKMMLAQNTDFIRLSQVAKLLDIIYIPENEILTELSHMAANIRWLTFNTIIVCDDPVLAFLSTPWCRLIDAFILTSSECRTERAKPILEMAKTIYVIGKIKEKLPKLKNKKIEQLANDPVTLTYQLHERLTKRVGESWDHFINSEYRDLFPTLQEEEFGQSIVITSKESNDLSYLILAANYAAAKLSSLLLIERDEPRLKIEADLFKQLDQLTYKRQYEESGSATNLKGKMLSKIFSFSKDLRTKYFDERYEKLLDHAKFISVITDIPIPLELMQYGGENSILAQEKAMGRLCSTTIEETSILIQFSVLHTMMQSSEVKKAAIIQPKYFDRYKLYYGSKEVQRAISILGSKNNLGEKNIELIVDRQLTKQQFIRHLQKYPWLFIHYIGHGDLIDQESAFMVQPSEYIDLIPVRAQDLPIYLKGQPVFIANACLSGRYQESAEGLSGLVFEIIKRGAISFIGTLWEVDDYFASEFIAGLYLELLNGNFLGTAVKKSRTTILDKNDPTYGAYILFGDPMVRVR